MLQKETKEIVVERIQAEEAAARGAREGPKELGDIHTDDEEDEEAEYELWRQRELRRIRRYALDPGMQDDWVPSTLQDDWVPSTG